jgi:GNAT superfamily N-acetyltransferase
MHELIVVEPAECHGLRDDVLPPSERGAYPTDEAEGAMHLALKDEGRALAVVSILPERRDEVAALWRLRGLAVSAGHRREGLGAKLVGAVLMIVGERGGGLWCSAPHEVVGFLESCGLTSTGPVDGALDAEPDDSADVLMTWHRPAKAPA